MSRCTFSAPGHCGPPTDHFDGRRFFYPGAGPGEKSFRELMKWRLGGTRGAWRHRPLAGPSARPEAHVGGGRLRATFVNHSTVLLQMDGMNILTDPVWSERTSPVPFAGPRRFRPVGVAFDDLPRIHAVVVSHNHYDHLDIATLRRLERAHGPRILVPLGNGALLSSAGIGGWQELDWWQSAGLGGGVHATLTPCLHWSARGTRDRRATLWGGFALRSDATGLVYYAGDTGYGAFYGDVRERFGAPRLALLPIGAYKPRWFMGDMHQDPREAVQAHRDLGARASIAVHWGTFQLADDGMDDAPNDLRAALSEAGIGEHAFRLLENGEAFDIPAVA